MAAAAPVIALVAGTAIEVGSGFMSAAAQKDALQREAAYKNLEADELLDRAAINERILRDQGNLAIDEFQAASYGPGIGGALRAKRNLENTILNQRRETEFKARMLRAGANVELGQVDSIQNAALVGGFGKGLKGAAAIASAIPKEPKDLGQFGGSGYGGRTSSYGSLFDSDVYNGSSGGYLNLFGPSGYRGGS